jgi:hypothetical protein
MLLFGPVYDFFCQQKMASVNSSVKSLKLNYEGEMRRLAFDQCFSKEKPSIKGLETLVHKSFMIPSESKFALTYFDEDKDVITVSTDGKDDTISVCWPGQIFMFSRVSRLQDNSFFHS